MLFPFPSLNIDIADNFDTVNEALWSRKIDEPQGVVELRGAQAWVLELGSVKEATDLGLAESLLSFKSLCSGLVSMHIARLGLNSVFGFFFSFFLFAMKVSIFDLKLIKVQILNWHGILEIRERGRGLEHKFANLNPKFRY